MGKAKLELQGLIFGYLTVLKQNGRASNAKLKWDCLCKCGKEVNVNGTDLKSGHTKSCGCYSVQRAITHNLSYSRIYKIWNGMLQRVTNPKNNHYNYYGGRGVTVDQKWLKFDNFYKDMFESYEAHLTLDRKDNTKGYNKENCRWVSMRTQIRNRDITIRIESPWGLLTLPELAEISGIKQQCLRTRYIRKWPTSKMFIKPQNRTFLK